MTPQEKQQMEQRLGAISIRELEVEKHRWLHDSEQRALVDGILADKRAAERAKATEAEEQRFAKDYEQRERHQAAEQQGRGNARTDGVANQNADAHPAQEQYDAENHKGWTARLIKRINEYSDALLALFTAILAFSTLFLWIATRDLVKGSERIGTQQVLQMVKSADAAEKASKVAEDTLKLTQRAVLSADTVLIEDGSHLVVQLRNVGRTTARNVTNTAWWQAPRSSESPHPPQNLNRSTPLTIGIGVMLPVVVGRDPDFKPYWDDIRNASRVLYFQIEFAYEDIFGAPHTLVCHGRYDPTTNRFDMTSNEGD
jgi:hypothetical protein